jgi:hypothetical protein
MNIRGAAGAGCRGLVLLGLALAASEAGAQAIAVTTQPATAVTTVGATLNGTVNGNGGDIAAVYFDYGTTITYDHLSQNAAPFSVTAAQGATPVALTIGGLACASTYHFRVTADDANGRNTQGTDLSFVTAPCVVPVTVQVPVPTLSEWSLLALGAAIGLAAWAHRRRRRTD